MDTPIVIIITAYIFSFAFLGVQAVVGDPMGIEMKVYDSDTGGFTGTDLRTSINNISDTFAGCYDSTNSLIGGFGNQTYVTEIECTYADPTNQWISGTNSTFSNLSYQTAQMQLTMADQDSVTDNPITQAGAMVYLIFQVMSGTYVFNLLAYMGIPLIFVTGISMIYIILISIWTIMLLRGNNIN
uniref:ORF11 n=1 Tax=Nitrosopumilaceae spindle-shaped virus TaxID=3065433 RepID=A0AAT9J760_9VIRU